MVSMKKDYQILEAASPRQLAEAVTKKLAEGYELVGQPFLFTGGFVLQAVLGEKSEVASDAAESQRTHRAGLRP